MAAGRKLIYGLVMILMGIFIKSNNVETQDEVQGELNYVAKPDPDSISKILNNLNFRCYFFIF
jgi:hypothetical protein